MQKKDEDDEQNVEQHVNVNPTSEGCTRQSLMSETSRRMSQISETARRLSQILSEKLRHGKSVVGEECLINDDIEDDCDGRDEVFID